jgi:hypothetical protein
MRIKFVTLDDTSWKINYTHHIENYSECSYVNDQSSEEDADPIIKTFDMSFGKNLKKRYFITGAYNRFRIYKNSRNILRVINADYDLELDSEEQDDLIERYSNNTNIPEWLALNVFIFMIENEWDDIDLINHMTIV